MSAYQGHLPPGQKERQTPHQVHHSITLLLPEFTITTTAALSHLQETERPCHLLPHTATPRTIGSNSCGCPANSPVAAAGTTDRQRYTPHSPKNLMHQMSAQPGEWPLPCSTAGTTHSTPAGSKLTTSGPIVSPHSDAPYGAALAHSLIALSSFARTIDPA